MPGRPFVELFPSGRALLARESETAARNETAPPCALRRRGGVALPMLGGVRLSRNCSGPTACIGFDSLRFRGGVDTRDSSRQNASTESHRRAPTIGETGEAGLARDGEDTNRGLIHQRQCVGCGTENEKSRHRCSERCTWHRPGHSPRRSVRTTNHHRDATPRTGILIRESPSCQALLGRYLGLPTSRLARTRLR
jgi:hypothetical protein